MAFGDKKTMTTADGFTPEAFTWNNAMLEITNSSADSWFASLNPTAIEDLLTSAELGGPEDREQLKRFAPAFFDENSKNAIPNLDIEFDSLGEQMAVEDTVIGKKLIRILTKLGVSWAYNDRKAISHALSIEWSGKDEGLAQFPNYFGLPVAQRFRIYVDSQGKETLVWSAELLVATREYLHETEFFTHDGDSTTSHKQSPEFLASGGMSFGRWSEKIHIPVFMKRLFYLAETPFPSTTMLTMSRSIAFKDVPAENMPRPFISFERDGMAIGAFEESGSTINWSGSIFPTVMHGGWLFTNEDETELETSLIVASNGITRISSILEDGFHNYQRDDYPAPYDETLLCANVFDRSFGNGQPANGRSKWIPGSRIGLLIKETENKFHHAVSLGSVKEARRELWSILDDGAGQFVAAAGNNIAWYFFMPELSKSPQDLPVYERILLQAARLKVNDDSVNCLSNLGILNYMAYNTARAIELFEMVIENEDSYSDNEAYFYLAHIYEQLGETSRAAEYRHQYSQVTPYGWPIQEQIPISLAQGATEGEHTPSQESVPSVSSHEKSGSKFCGSCGIPFDTESVKFCGQCGTARK